MTDYSKIAREIVGQWKYQGHGYDVDMPFRDDHDLNPLVDKIAIALEAAHQNAMASKVVGPSDEDIWNASNSQKDVKDSGEFRFGARWYRDSLKLVPISVEDILPSKEEFENQFGKDPYIEGKHDRFGTPDGRIREGAYDAYDYIREYVRKKLNEKEKI